MKEQHSAEGLRFAPLIKGGWGGFDESVLKERGLITTGFHLPYNPRLKEAARQLRKNQTPAEKKIWYEYFASLESPVLRQRPIDNYIVDFYCPEYRLVVEIDGDSHFTDDGKTYDEERTRILEQYGLRILRFGNEDVLQNLDGVVSSIEETIQELRKTRDNRNKSPLPPPLNKGGEGRGVIMKHIWAPWRIEYVQAPKPKGCILCEKPAAIKDVENYILYRGRNNFVMLNAYPYNPGHLMIAPYRHIASPEEMTAEERHEHFDIISLCLKALREEFKPGGFNVGINMGGAAGAGIEDHVHSHIVPRWDGDTNFITTIGDVRVVPEALVESYKKLKERF